MRTIISGPVSQQHLDDAEFMAGIKPTQFITNGSTTPPASDLETLEDPPCPKLPGEIGEFQRNYTMCLQAEALVCVGGNEHLVNIANKYGLAVYEAEP